MLTDIEIVQKAKKEPIGKIARKLKIGEKYLIPHGHYIAKIDLALLEKIKNKPKGKYVVVTAITPTPLGEGKTVTTIGLSMALNKLGKLTADERIDVLFDKGTFVELDAFASIRLAPIEVADLIN